MAEVAGQRFAFGVAQDCPLYPRQTDHRLQSAGQINDVIPQKDGLQGFGLLANSLGKYIGEIR